VIAAPVLKEPLGARRIAGFVLGVAGVALIVNLGPIELDAHVISAAVAAMAGAFFWGWAGVVIRQRTGRVPAMGLATGSIILCALILSPAWAQLPAQFGGWTIGVLVQTNFGGELTIAGVPVGRELRTGEGGGGSGDGSIIMVVATDAPLDHLRLQRLAQRALAGLARTGSAMSNGSGDYVIAFSTARPGPASPALARLTDTVEVVRNDAMSGLFQATIDATEEAIDNSLLRAETVRGYRGVVRAVPVDSTIMILKRYGAIPR